MYRMEKNAVTGEPMNKTQFFNLSDVDQLRMIGDQLAEIENPALLFGDGITIDQLKSRGRNFQKFLHPDSRAGKEDDDLAGKAFKIFMGLYDHAKSSMESGNYGKSNIKTDAENESNDINIGGETYQVLYPIGVSDIGSYYLIRNDKNDEFILHLCDNPSNNDLMENERNILSKIKIHEVYDEFEGCYYIPEIVTSFKTTSGLSANILRIESFNPDEKYSINHMSPLSKVIDKIGRENINIRHIGWIFNRIISGFNVSHYIGVVNAGITPDSIWISTHPESHAGVLMNWCHASYGQSIVKSVSSRWISHYPLEIMNKQLPDFTSDFFMAAKAMQWAFSIKKNSPIDKYFSALTLPYTHLRLGEIGYVSELWQETIFEAEGWKREFIQLNINGNGQNRIDWSWFW